ncbi:Maf family protein [Candidatus Babeliales bacterium]|nr:Maf family protein [Candidatus Babeliales bacterium]MBP9843888.1 Maf family protein [Candidatus Babeliales bacterium]
MIKFPYVLYIASNSASRKNLLEQAQIPFRVIAQDADESLIDTNQSLSQIVTQIAQLKMQHAQIPQGEYENEICFVLTADTMGLTKSGRILTKPVDRADAIMMLEDARIGTLTVTGFCLRKLQWQQGFWVVVEEVVDVDQANSIFNVPDQFLDFYLDAIPFLSVSGAISIEGIGAQFLASVSGSYEAVVGLPMFKLRDYLFAFGFYNI